MKTQRIRRRGAQRGSVLGRIAAGMLVGHVVFSVGCGVGPSAPTAAVAPGAPVHGAELGPLIEAEGETLAEVSTQAELDRRSTIDRRSGVDLLPTLAVYHDDFARQRFYSWTSAEQAASLCAGGALLVADASTGGRPTPDNRALAELASATDEAGEVARLLRDHPQLRRRRYAWSSSYATVLGLGPRGYGDELIEVELDPRSIIAKFEPGATSPLTFVDVGGGPVTLAEVLAEPLRIGAVYHVRDHTQDHTQEHAQDHTQEHAQEHTQEHAQERRREHPYREYVLCNPAMIRRWSLRTPAIAARLERERELLKNLTDDAFSRLPAEAITGSAAPVWSRRRASDRVALWGASLAFDTPRYRPSRGNLERIIAALASARVGGPACGSGLIANANANAEPRTAANPDANPNANTQLGR